MILHSLGAPNQAQGPVEADAAEARFWAGRPCRFLYALIAGQAASNYAPVRLRIRRADGYHP